MTGAAGVLLALTMVIAAADWFAVGTGNRTLEYVAKPATMIALLGVALTLDPVDGAARSWLVVALVLCLLGDVFLMLPSDRFVEGLAAFLLGHIAYVVGLVHLGVDVAGALVGIVLVAAAVPILGVRIVRAVRTGPEPELQGPVVAYMAVISMMVVAAWATTVPVAAAGAVSFYASDALIAWTRFVRDLAWGRVAVIVTYHLAQVGLVLALV